MRYVRPDRHDAQRGTVGLMARDQVQEPKRRCGPWDERPDGTHACRKCGRLDPLDFDLDQEEEHGMGVLRQRPQDFERLVHDADEGAQAWHRPVSNYEAALIWREVAERRAARLQGAVSERDAFARALTLAVASPELREAYVRQAKDALARELPASALGRAVSLDDPRLLGTLARVIEDRHGALPGIGGTLREALAEFARETGRG